MKALVRTAPRLISGISGYECGGPKNSGFYRREHALVGCDEERFHFGGRVAFALGHAHPERGVGRDVERASFVGVEVGVVDHEQAAGRERGRGCGEERGPGGIHNEPSGRRERPSNSGRPFCSRSGRLTLSRAVEADPGMGCLDLGLAAVGCHARRLVKPGTCGLGTFLGA